VSALVAGWACRCSAATSWGICLWPLMRRKDRSALSMPAAVQRSTICPLTVIPLFSEEPDTGFGTDVGGGAWAAPGLITSLRKNRLIEFRRRVDVQELTDVNNMLFRILATPDS